MNLGFCDLIVGKELKGKVQRCNDVNQAHLRNLFWSYLS